MPAMAGLYSPADEIQCSWTITEMLIYYILCSEFFFIVLYLMYIAWQCEPEFLSQFIFILFIFFNHIKLLNNSKISLI